MSAPSRDSLTLTGEPTLALDGVVLHTEPDPLTNLEAYGPEELFHIAREMSGNDRVEDAVLVYERLLENFPASGFAEPAWFNLGLVYERLENFHEAANAYYAISSEPLPTGTQRRRTWLDAHYRLAVCFGKLDAWWRAVAVFDDLLALEWISPDDRLEALLGRGIALQGAGDPASAEVALATVLRHAREADRQGPLAERGMVAEAAFRMGEISADRYSAVVLEFPVTLLGERLEEKCHHLLAAQYRFLRAIRHGDAHTVAAAGFRIGQLYESLHDTIHTLEVPTELTTEQTEIYHEEVRRRIQILVVKALKIYEQALTVGRSAATAADWNQKLERAIERLKSIYLAESEVAFTQP